MKVRYPLPFWSWNDELHETEIVRQIGNMSEQSLGGFFMHARGGLRTEYMEDDWFRMVSTAVTEANRTGMEPWLYDENGWPSGFAGGAVPALGERYQQKYLRLREIDRDGFEPTSRLIAMYDATSHQRCISLDDTSSPSLLIAEYETNPYYVDTLDQETTERFIELTHEQYRKKLSSEIFQSIQGFFTDEPQISRSGIPWSEAIVREYQTRFNDDLLLRIPQLFFEKENYEETRYRFWYSVTHLFSQNFFRPISEWCRRNGMQLTGHLVKEESYRDQVQSNGSVMAHYEYFDLPGMDWLGRGIGPVTTPVQVSSVSAQLGKPGVLSETFALCGWHLTFQEMKRMYNWQMVYGVTVLCPHLQSYSLRGLRKRDYPPSLFFQQPWWPDYGHFVRRVSFIGSLLANGTPLCNVLVIHGQRSAWIEHNSRDNGITDTLNGSLLEVSHALSRAFVPFHYADEFMIERHGDLDEKQLRIGTMRYDVVIIPSVTVLGSVTLDLLREFVRSGGVVYSLSPIPPLRDGRRREADVRFWDELQHVETGHDLVHEVINKHGMRLPFDLSFDQSDAIESNAIIGTARNNVAWEDTVGTVYFFVNMDSIGHELRFTNPDSGYTEIDPDTGRSQAIESNSVVLPPGGEAILFRPNHDFSHSRGRIIHQSFKPTTQPSTRTIVPISWELRAATPNSITLDVCDCWVDGEPFRQSMPICDVLDELLQLQRDVDLRLDFRFEVRQVERIRSSVELLMEDPALWEVTVNDRPIQWNGSGWRFDTAFQSTSIGSALRSGINRIRLETRFSTSDEQRKRIESAKVFESEKNKLTLEREIEALYVIGDFSVRTSTTDFVPLKRNAERYQNPGPFVIGPRKRDADLCSLHRDGFPFFCGRITVETSIWLERDINHIEIEFDTLMGNSVEFQVDEEHVGTCYWHPYKVVSAKPLPRGEHRLQVTIVNSLRNMLGPHHLDEGECEFVGPFSFFSKDGVFSRTWSGELNSWNPGYVIQKLGVSGVRVVCFE